MAIGHGEVRVYAPTEICEKHCYSVRRYGRTFGAWDRGGRSDGGPRISLLLIYQREAGGQCFGEEV